MPRRRCTAPLPLFLHTLEGGDRFNGGGGEALLAVVDQRHAGGPCLAARPVQEPHQGRRFDQHTGQLDSPRMAGQDWHRLAVGEQPLDAVGRCGVGDR